MAYTGSTVAIPLGQLGLHTDDPMAAIPPNAAIKANNVSLYKSKVLKSPGSTPYTTTALPADIVACIDYWPTATSQRLVALTADGKIWRDTGDGTWGTMTNLPVVETQQLTASAVPDAGSFQLNFATFSTPAINFNATAAVVQTAVRTLPGLGSATVEGDWVRGFTIFMFGTSGSQAMITVAPNTLTKTAVAVTLTMAKLVAGNTGSLGVFTTDCHMVACGAESAGKPRRLVIFTGGVTTPLVLTGDGSNVTALSSPAADWTSSFPTFGITFQAHLVIFGNENSPHRMYVSTLADHTNFSTAAVDGSGASTFPIFSGDGDRLIGGIVYKKSSLIMFKRPHGSYVFNWNGGDVTNPANFNIDRFSDAFGVGSPHAVAIVEDDLWGGANTGSVFSLSATQAFGSFEKGDVLQLAQARDEVRNTIDLSGCSVQHMVYYPEKQQALVTHRTPGSLVQNLILQIDMARNQPRVSFETKDKPTCLAMRRDANGVLRPMYGSPDGKIYLMDQSARNVNGVAYVGEFQTPYIDFSYMDQSLADKVKLFDFLQVTYLSTGQWPFNIDIFVDGNFVQTITFTQSVSSSTLGTFTLDRDFLGGNSAPKALRKKLSAAGKAISFRIYNSGLNQHFQVERLVVGFRASAEQNRSSKG